MNQSVSLSGDKAHAKEQIKQMQSAAARVICNAIVDASPGNRISLTGSVYAGEDAQGSAGITVNLTGSSWTDTSPAA
jgi:hypothetical protein